MKHKLIILEGADCSGKTTLAKFLARQFRAAYFKMTRTKALQGTLLMYDYMRTMQAAIEWNLSNDVPVILDRCWISEYVYSQAIRPEDHTYWKAYYPDLQRHLRALGALYVFCERGDIITAHRQNLNSDHPYTDEQMRIIAHMYRDFRRNFEGNGDAVFVYNFDIMAHDLKGVAAMVEALE